MRAGHLALFCLLLCLPGRAWALAMQVSNISDFTIATPWSIGDPAIQAHMDLCIYGLNIPTLLSYAITVSSSPGGYKIKTGTRTIPFSLYWDDSGPGNLGSSLGTQLTDGVKISGLHNVNILTSNCALGGPNARLNMLITQADMTAALSGTYSGTLTILLSPN